MSKIENKLSAAYDTLKLDSDSINVHEVVQEAMRDIKWTWATYKKYSDTLFGLMGIVFTSAQRQESREVYEWHTVNIEKMEA